MDLEDEDSFELRVHQRILKVPWTFRAENLILKVSWTFRESSKSLGQRGKPISRS